jgi:hypothetical protein
MLRSCGHKVSAGNDIVFTSSGFFESSIVTLSLKNFLVVSAIRVVNKIDAVINMSVQKVLKSERQSEH